MESKHTNTVVKKMVTQRKQNMNETLKHARSKQIVHHPRGRKVLKLYTTEIKNLNTRTIGTGSIRGWADWGCTSSSLASLISSSPSFA